nr:zinc finger, CCHC-type [Tanacetum cinerariifolium]
LPTWQSKEVVVVGRGLCRTEVRKKSGKRKEAVKKAGCSDGKGRRYEKGGIMAIVEGEAHDCLGLRGGLLGATGYRQVKVFEFFDCPGPRQGVEDLRELLHKHGGPKQVGFKQLGTCVETGVHRVHDEKRVWFEVKLQKLRFFRCTAVIIKTRVPGQEGAKGNVAERYKEYSNDAAFAVAVVEKIYAYESLTFNDTVASTVAEKAVTTATTITGSMHQGLLVKAKGNILGLEIIRDKSGNTLRVSQSRIHNKKLVQTLLKGHFTLSLEDSLSWDYNVEKNGSLKANLQHMETLSITEARYMTFTKARKTEIWLKGLLTKSGYELSGEVVVGGKRQKLPRRRRREIEHEEDPPSSPSNSYCEVVTLLVREGASGFVRNTFSINQQESSSYEYQQSMVLKGITPVLVRTSQESHTWVTNIRYNHVPTDVVTATITNYPDEMHSTHSNSGRTPPSVQHQLTEVANKGPHADGPTTRR